jgi:hypothetical protein
MKLEIIKTEDYILAVSVENMGSIGYISHNNSTFLFVQPHDKKIIAYKPLKNKVLEGLPLLPDIDRYDVDNVKKLSDDYTEKHYGKRRVDVYIQLLKI